MLDLVQWILFLLFSILVLGGALGVFLTMSMYRAGISLMLCLVAMAGLFILLEADLLAVIQVMMNVGGMLVMTLFMVMLMMDPGGEMMWDMKRRMRMKGLGALSMSMPSDPDASSPKRSGSGQAKALSPPVANRPPAAEADQAGKAQGLGLAQSRDGKEGESGGTETMADNRQAAMRSSEAATSPESYRVDGDPYRRMREIQRSIAIMQQQLGFLQQQLVDLQEDLLATTPAGSSGGNGPQTDIKPQHGPSPSHSHQMSQSTEQPETEKAGSSPTIYTCPMHPEVRLPNPGRCPKCGMDLVPAEPQATAEGENNVSTPATGGSGSQAAKTMYTCPMHPEVRQSGPGRCPKCGMDLVPESGDGNGGDDNEAGSSQGEGQGQGGGQPSPGKMDMPGGHDHGHMMHSSSKGGGQVETAEQLQKRSPRAYYRMMEGMAMSTRQLPLAAIFSMLVGLMLVILVLLVAWPARPVAPDLDGPSRVGDLLLSDYMIAFEGAAFLILAGILGAVLLARRETKKKRGGKDSRLETSPGGQHPNPHSHPQLHTHPQEVN